MLKITKISESSYTYQEDNNPVINLDDKAIVLEKKTGIYWLKLPENSLNRKLVSTKKFTDTDTVILDKIKTAPAKSETSRKGWKEYLTEQEIEELDVLEKNYLDKLNEYKRKANERRDEQKNKPLTEKEKAQRKLDKAIAELMNLGLSEKEIKALLKK